MNEVRFQPVELPKAQADSPLVRWVSAAVGVLLLAATAFIWKQGPGFEATTMDPIRTRGSIGEVVSNDFFAMKVTKVEAARSVKAITRVRSTSGIFVVVSFEAQGVGEPWDLSRARIESGGKRFDTEDSTMGGTYQPEMWKPGRISFELPKHRVAGARLVVGRMGLIDQLGPELEIDLKLSDRAAAALIANAAEAFEARP